jgi:alpha-methylacyl-CoA racemase
MTPAQGDSSRAGPLPGVRIVEFAGLGPAPFATMLLADLGADVVRIDRPGQSPHPADVTCRGRRSLAVDLKDSAGVALCLAALDKADVLIEGFRPGVMEKLGLGPDILLARNPRLIYGRMTGWGQNGPLAQTAGHDINYIALTGALAAIGGPDIPSPPLNLVGDFGGGALYLALGIVAALFERSQSGKGQVIDAAIVDGTASMMSFFQGIVAMGMTGMSRGSSLLGGSAPFYGCYACADGKFVSVGPLEPQFFAQLLAGLELDPAAFVQRDNPETWAEGRGLLAAAFGRRTRDAWCEVFEGSDACFAPVLDLAEAPLHPHMAARGIYVEQGGILQGNAAPRLSRTPGKVGAPPVAAGEGGRDAMKEWGVLPLS